MYEVWGQDTVAGNTAPAITAAFETSNLFCCGFSVVYTFIESKTDHRPFQVLRCIAAHPSVWFKNVSYTTEPIRSHAPRGMGKAVDKYPTIASAALVNSARTVAITEHTSSHRPAVSTIIWYQSSTTKCLTALQPT